MRRKWDLFIVWLREYFKHPLENVRTVEAVIPGKLYHNMGHVCKLVSLTDKEKEVLRLQQEHPNKEEYRQMLMTQSGKEFKSAGEIGRCVEMYGTVCQFCDFFKKSLACPPVCRIENEKYVIIKEARVHG